jgi:hypothetical protein
MEAKKIEDNMREKLIDLKCKELAQKGLQFSEELYDGNIEMYDRLFPVYDYFSIALSIALTWTKHAQYEFEFIKYACSFFKKETDLDYRVLAKYHYRFGDGGLADAMTGLLEYRDAIKNIIPDFASCDSKAFKKFQDRSLNILLNLKEMGKAYGVGPWLFLGPIKIIVGMEKRLWRDPGIDAIILPSGIEVQRGITKLIDSGFALAQSFDSHHLENEEKSLLEGFSIDTIIQNFLSQIAKRSDTRVLHINSAFYLLGSGK